MNDILDLQKNTESAAPEEKQKTLVERLIHERRLAPLTTPERLVRSFSPGERLVFYILSTILGLSALGLLIILNDAVSTTVPSRGGKLIEGAVGTPRFINPLLSLSQVDQDLTTLVYSGLMRATPEGDLVPDLAESYEVSGDGTVYTFTLRRDAKFQDGTPLTADDVAFTVALAQNPSIKSVRRADWEGVGVRAADERTVVFTLPNAYAPFLENAQMGILPKKLWEKVSAEEFPFHALNMRPVGSGPYKIRDAATDNTGTPLSYELSAFDGFALGSPHLATIVFRFYPNEDALLNAYRDGMIDSFAAVSPDKIAAVGRSDTRIVRAPSTRIFAVFLNQNRAPVLADAAARAALSAAVDRDALIEEVLFGYGTPAEGPIPPGLLPQAREGSATSTRVTFSDTGLRIESARQILSKGGWQFSAATTTAPRPPSTGTTTPKTDTPRAGSESTQGAWTKNKRVLSFSIATADTAELVKTAEAVSRAWKALGVDVSVQVYPLAEFNATVLRPRAYDAVLFGEVVGRTLDLFSFWHSSQRNDPGLNLALYANARADRVLAAARTEIDDKEREKLYQSFSDIIADENPAVFLYAPEFLYVVPEGLYNVSLGSLTAPSERFLSAHQWYTDTERVWGIFNSQK